MLGFVDHQRDGMENKLLLFVIPVCATRARRTDILVAIARSGLTHLHGVVGSRADFHCEGGDDQQSDPKGNREIAVDYLSASEYAATTLSPDPQFGRLPLDVPR